MLLPQLCLLVDDDSPVSGPVAARIALAASVALWCVTGTAVVALLR